LICASSYVAANESIWREDLYIPSALALIPFGMFILFAICQQKVKLGTIVADDGDDWVWIKL